MNASAMIASSPMPAAPIAVGDELGALQEELLGFSLAETLDWLRVHLLNVETAGQAIAVALVLAFALIVGPRLGRTIGDLGGRFVRDHRLRALGVDLRGVAAPFLAYAGFSLAAIAGDRLEVRTWLLHSAESLAAAWIVIRLASIVIRVKFWSRVVFYVAFGAAALDILGLLGPTIAWMERSGVDFGGVRLSVFTLFRAALAAALLLWTAGLATRLLERRISRVERLTPSLQILIVQIAKLAAPVLAIIVALGAVGVDLTAFAVFSGAVGVGVGLGLQSAVSNVVSGLMLIGDKSIKPGDVIAIGDDWGWVTALGPRYVALRTRDGVERLIPNDRFILEGVENWSYSEPTVRRKLPIEISYESDPRHAAQLCIEAAKETPRVLDDPKPVCLLKGFGASGLDLELRFWIDDPKNGLSNVASEVLFRVWDKFKAHQIEIPFPQRDIHLRGDFSPLTKSDQ